MKRKHYSDFQTHKYLLHQDLIRQNEQNDYKHMYMQVSVMESVTKCEAKVWVHHEAFNINIKSNNLINWQLVPFLFSPFNCELYRLIV